MTNPKTPNPLRWIEVRRNKSTVVSEKNAWFFILLNRNGNTSFKAAGYDSKATAGKMARAFKKWTKQDIEIRYEGRFGNPIK